MATGAAKSMAADSARGPLGTHHALTAASSRQAFLQGLGEVVTVTELREEWVKTTVLSPGQVAAREKATLRAHRGLLIDGVLHLHVSSNALLLGS